MNEITAYNPPGLGPPLGQYSYVTRVRAPEFVFVAGMLSAGDAEAASEEERFHSQCRGVFAQIGMALESAGLDWSHVVQFTTYLVDAADIERFMRFRQQAFPDTFGDRPYPPNTLLVIRQLVDAKFRIEVQTIAANATTTPPLRNAP